MGFIHIEVKLFRMNSDAHATSASDKRTTHVTEQVYGIENAHENLGDDFADSPWLQPDIGMYQLFCDMLGNL